MKKVWSALLSVTVLFTAVFALSVPSLAAVTYKPVNGGDVTLQKYLVVEADANVPAEEFFFTVAAGSAVAATKDTLAVAAGPSVASVKINGETNSANTGKGGKVSFAAGETATSALATEAGQTGKKAAKKEIVLSFADVSFDKPGVYRYILTEGAVSSPVSIVGAATTTIDIYIGDDGFDTTENKQLLKFLGSVAYDGVVIGAPKNTAVAADNAVENATKDWKHVNAVASTNLTIEKEVAGAQGDRTQEFEIEVKLNGVGANAEVAVDSQNTTATTITGTTANASGEATIKATFQHGDKLVLTGILDGATFQVSEVGVTAEAATGIRKTADGYTVTNEVLSDTAVNGQSVKIVNTRGGAVPTGVMTKMLPGVALILIALFLLARKKKPADK